MGAFLKQAATLLAGKMAGSNQKATFVVKTLRTTYGTSLVLISVVWYSAWRNERIEPGDSSFPVPGIKHLTRRFSADRPEKELDHQNTGLPPEPGSGGWGNWRSRNGAVMADGKKIRAKHPELKPGIAKITETVLQHFPKLVITATTNGKHSSTSLHYPGRAVDLAGDRQTMQAAARWISQNLTQSLTEGIHNTGLSVDGQRHVPSSFWGSETWAAHANHIHLAV